MLMGSDDQGAVQEFQVDGKRQFSIAVKTGLQGTCHPRLHGGEPRSLLSNRGSFPSCLPARRECVFVRVHPSEVFTKKWKRTDHRCYPDLKRRINYSQTS